MAKQITNKIQLFKKQNGVYGYRDTYYGPTWMDLATLNSYYGSRIDEESQKKLQYIITKMYNNKNGNISNEIQVMETYLSYSTWYDRVECLSHYIIPEETSQETSQEDTTTPKHSTKQQITEACNNIIKFFSEFEFEPNFRFLSTFTSNLRSSTSNDSAQKYVLNYFELSDKQCSAELKDKMKSYEFTENICEVLRNTDGENINKRLKIYYGSQGTGKTTEACKETNNNIIVCHSAMLPSDLMEDFEFDDGKAGFHKSALWKAMEEGKGIVLDEINLLPFESLRFLQGLLDEKASINYKGETINIKEGFYVIGTMNLEVNGCVYALPEPLVDRCFEIKKFTLKGSDLASMIC